jgi:hypothetical protein
MFVVINELFVSPENRGTFERNFPASAVAGNVRPRPVVQATLALATIRRRRSS